MTKGLKFTPIPDEDRVQLGTDIDEFCRRLRLNYMFFEEDEESNDVRDEPLVRNKSSFNPKPTKDKHLEETINNLKTNPLENRKNVKDNLSRGERKALSQLKSDQTIIIKEADKGSAVVIMDRDFYRDKILEMLNDNNFYKETDGNADKRTRNLILKLLKKYDSELYEEEKDYIANFTFSSSYFYGLPKVHKSTELSEAIAEQNSEYIEILRPTDLKFRPIVGGPNSVSQRLSHFVDIILKPLCEKVPSFIRDDLDFLNHLPTSVSPNSELITFDVVSLYTNIPHEFGIAAVSYWLEKHRDTILPRFSKDFILDSLRLILQNNAFYFDSKYYIQEKGTAMGTKMAPTYATLVLGYLENIMYENVESNYGSNFAVYIKQNWFRFLDDCFILWNSDIPIENFQSDLNSLNENIQFTLNRSKREIPFLDVLVQITEDNSIHTDIFSKSTDTHNYLNFKSSHPKHTKLNIPFNLASRIITIANTEASQTRRLEELKTFLRKQQYPESIIEHGIRKAREKGPIISSETRDLPMNTPNTNDIIPFVTTFNPRNFDVFNLYKTIEPTLQLSEKMRKVLSKKKTINSKRQPKNLKRLLSSSKFDFNPSVPSVKKCSDKRCKTCPNIIEGSSITYKNGKNFSVRQQMSCKTKNLIYSAICKNCEEFYIGETKLELKTRMTLHRQQTNNENLTILRANRHFRECSNGEFYIFPLYKVNVDSDYFRKRKEEHFINILKPSLNDK